MPLSSPSPKRARFLARVGLALFVLLLIALVAGALVLRAWLPALSGRKADIEAYLSTISGQQVRFASLTTFWDGIHPGVRVTDVEMRAPVTGALLARVDEVSGTLAWMPVLRGDLVTRSLSVVHPVAGFVRGRGGAIGLAGAEAVAAAPGTSDARPALAWLFAQHDVRVVDGTLTWQDQRAHAPPLDLRYVNIAVRNVGNRHRLEVHAQWPKTLCVRCDFTLELVGDPTDLDHLTGRLTTDVDALDLANLPPIAREHGLRAARGRVSGALSARWDGGELVALRGRVLGTKLSVPYPGLRAPLALRGLSGSIDARRTGGDWDATLRHVEIGVTRAPWKAGTLRLRYGPDGVRLAVDRVEPQEVTAVAALLPSDNAALAALRSTAPRGELSALRVRIDGPLDRPTDFHVQADARKLAMTAYAPFPGIHGFTGHIDVARDGGSLDVDTGALTLTVPGVFPEPLQFKTASGRLLWRKSADGWTVNAERVRVDAAGGQVVGTLALSLPFDKAVSPRLRLDVRGRHIDLARARRFLPLVRLPLHLFRWLDESVVAGRLTQGEVHYDGRVRDFPFVDRPGRYAIAASVEGATFAYLPAWTPMTQVAAHVAVDGARVKVTGEGKLLGLSVSNVVVGTDDWRGDDARLTIQGDVAGPVNDTLKVLAQAPIEDVVLRVPMTAHARGNGDLALTVELPLHHPKAYTLTGHYRVERATLGAGIEGLDARDVNGQVDFTRAGPAAGHVSGRLLGAPFTLTVTSPDQGRSAQWTAHGAIEADALAPVVGSRARAFDGSARVHAVVNTAQGALPRVYVNADLTNAALRLPAPLNKARGEPLAFVAQTQSGAAHRQALAIALGARVRALVMLDSAPSLRVQAASVEIGAGPLATPPASGIFVRTRLPALDLDAWSDWWSIAATPPANVARPAIASAPSLPPVRFVGKVGAFRAGGRDWGALQFALRGDRDQIRGELNGDRLAGHVKLLARGRGQVELDLARLFIPPANALGPAPGGPDTGPDPRAVPELVIKVADFRWGKEALGRLDLWATPMPDGLDIRHLALVRPETNVWLRGRWTDSGAGRTTDVEGEIASKNIGTTLNAFGVPDQVRGGEGKLTVHARWPGGPMSFSLPQAQMDAKASARDGRFLQIRQGAGKLLGLFDIRSVARVLTLDFRSVFGKGFPFDRLNGDMRIDQGKASTGGIRLEGPSADIDIAGSAGLVSEDFDLRVSVTPQLSTGLAVASGLWGGPAAGAAVLLMQKLLHKQIEAGTRMVYLVKGPWDHPDIKRAANGPRDTSAENHR